MNTRANSESPYRINKREQHQDQEVRLTLQEEEDETDDDDDDDDLHNGSKHACVSSALHFDDGGFISRVIINGVVR